MFALFLLAAVNMGSTDNTKLCDFTTHNNNDFINTSIVPLATMGTYKSNRPCDYVSYYGELCPWHSLPGEKFEPWFEVAPTRPQTWEDVQTLIIEIKTNIGYGTTIFL